MQKTAAEIADCVLAKIAGVGMGLTIPIGRGPLPTEEERQVRNQEIKKVLPAAMLGGGALGGMIGGLGPLLHDLVRKGSPSAGSGIRSALGSGARGAIGGALGGLLGSTLYGMRQQSKLMRKRVDAERDSQRELDELRRQVLEQQLRNNTQGE